jgi:hypothetical protein
VKIFSRLPALLMLLAILASPAMACALAHAATLCRQPASCEQMTGMCNDTRLSSRAACCTMDSSDRSPYLPASGTVSADGASTVLGHIAAAIPALANGTAADAFVTREQSPPQSRFALAAILRI